MSVLRSVKKRKKNRKLGKIEVIDREEYGELELDTKVELIRTLDIGVCFHSCCSTLL